MLNILIAEKDFSPVAKKVLTKAGRVIDYGSKENFLKNLPQADAAVVGLEIKFNKSLLDKAPHLKLIGSRTTQLRYLDLAECLRRNIKVVNIKAESSVLKKTFSTAEETMALIFSVTRCLPWAFESVKKGNWERKKYGGIELMDKTIGLVGFGRLGRMVAKYSQAFGMHILAYDPYISNTTMKSFGVKKTTLEKIFKGSDIISLHCVYDDKTLGMIREGHFKSMKRTAFLINTARGEITDESALLKALKNKWLAGAAIDTLANEAPDGSHLINNPLIVYAKTHENLLILPHLGGATREATERTQIYISELVANEIKSWKK